MENNELEFDHCLASFDMADKIKHLQKVLREKMPHTRRGKKFVIPIVQATVVLIQKKGSGSKIYNDFI